MLCRVVLSNGANVSEQCNEISGLPEDRGSRFLRNIDASLINYTLPLNMEARGSPETSVNVYWTTQRYISEYSRLRKG
jgi:hypothetical protein